MPCIRALEGDLSLLRELHQEKTGDVLDAAADTVQDELNSQLIEAESRELGAINEAIGRIRAWRVWRLRKLRQADPADASSCDSLRNGLYRLSSQSQSRQSSAGGAVMWNRVFDNAEVDSV